MNNIFKLFACCQPVKGYKRSIIYDIQRIEYFFIPNILYEILTECKGESIPAIINKYGDENVSTINEYFDFLLKNELGFWCHESELELYPDLDLSWDHPSFITNAIIDFDANSRHDLKKISLELSKLLCLAIQFRFYHVPTIDFLLALLADFKNSTARHIDIMLPFHSSYSQKALEQLHESNYRLSYVTLFNTKKIRKIESKQNNFSVFHIKDGIKSEQHCGQINPLHFQNSCNTSFFTEAQSFNSCLNRKIAIDVQGNIKNCPSLSQHFGNIQDTSLIHVFKKENGLQQYWMISKDQIKVCRDCEFRYMCTDCRAYTTDPIDLYSKPVKCKYDPYEAEWLP
ncbi:grasp-with-spasm system SPASM domain peptide maturase [Chitinophaga polysaccharea]|uniref:grasp-with-spasm system SPASM domain peptide maturase n=1 Tax=Chitinophaga polysaccharea TaxID=1293035 RepID=UPI001159443B|nr:grasp-with-spasm system SPASM domain peptide maturase [Chitinophaga polysaccharea]